MNQICLAVVGAGLIGRRHIELVGAHNDCRCVAICDVEPTTGQLAEELGVAFYNDVEKMLQQENLDGVIIATPNEQHVGLGITCAEQGLDLLVEKPIATTLVDAQRLVDAAKRNRIELVVGHYRRFNPIMAKTHEIVRNGALGDIVSATVLWVLRKPPDYYDVEWRTRPGGGIVLINLIHEVDCLRFICGNIRSVFAATSSTGRSLGVEDTAGVTLQFQSGAIGTISASDAAPAPWSWEAAMAENPKYFHAGESWGFFCGTRASLSIPRMDIWSYANQRDDGWGDPLLKDHVEVEQYDPMTAQLDNFCRVIRRAETPAVSGVEGLRTLSATLAILESAQKNAPVEPAIPG